MGYDTNPIIIDKKFEKQNELILDQVKEVHKNQKDGDEEDNPVNMFSPTDTPSPVPVKKEGSPLGWIMQAAGAVAGGVGAAMQGEDIGGIIGAAGKGALSPTSAVGDLSAGISTQVNKDDVAEAEKFTADKAEAQAALDKANATSGNNLSAGGYGQQVQGADPSQSVFSNGSLDPSKYTDLTGNTTGATAVVKKLGEVKSSYTNLKQSALEYNKSAAMMTISGVSSLEKKGCYKPK